MDCVFAIFRRTMRGRSPFSPDMEHFHHRLMAKGLSHGKAVLAMWAMAFSCSLVSIAAAFGKGDQLFAVFVFFGLGGFILLRYLGYFRFEFFGEGLSTLIEDRKSTKTVEQAIKDAEQIVSNAKSLEELEQCLCKVAEGMQFQKAIISFFYESSRLGVELGKENAKVDRIVQWQDPEQIGYFSRDKEFSAQFSLTGRNFAYGTLEYIFMDGRNNLSVQDEVLLERIHDSISLLARKLRKESSVES